MSLEEFLNYFRGMRDNSAAVKIPVEYVDDLDPKYKDFRIAMLAKSRLIHLSGL